MLACPPHLLDKTAYRAPSNQDSTVYPSEPMRVTSCAAVKGSVFMVPSVIRSVMSSASSSNVVGFVRLLSAPCRIDRRRLSDNAKAPSSFLLKTPDLVLADLDAPRSFTIVDIKIVDPAAASYVNMTSRSALHQHRALEIAGPRDYFGPSRRPPPGARMRVKPPL